ncbi:hypothetical protein MtrunA17_Chr1g0188641 [Medicago truncatula]|nr:hypothetical protein MtrunA17_Chr1g0188641 [Medicago truncatula]
MQVPQLGEAGLTIESGSISLSTYEIIATLLMIILSHRDNVKAIQSSNHI